MHASPSLQVHVYTWRPVAKVQGPCVRYRRNVLLLLLLLLCIIIYLLLVSHVRGGENWSCVPLGVETAGVET